MNIKILFLLITTFSIASSQPPKQRKHGKLLYILLDGFRYDYVTSQPAEAIPNFSKLLKNGIRAEYVNPLTPSLSYPTWTTLSTGLYAESHNLIGNYFYDPSDKSEFSLFDPVSTGKKKWWNSEPLWITATKAGLRAALYLWSRCDIEFDGVTADTCEKFVKITGKEIFRTNIEKALDKFQNGYDLVQVYTEHTDNIGHTIGPETEEMKQAVRELDETIGYLLDRLEQMNMQDEVNIVIVSDHGMANTAPGSINRIEIDDYLPPNLEGIENIADKGTYINIKVEPGYKEAIYDRVRRMPGVRAYKKEDIPESFHVKKGKYMHDILLMADLNTFVMASRSPKQLPPRNDDFVYFGAHGYSRSEMKMKAIFFAHGPAFKKDLVINPIDIVDVYQVLMHALKLEAQPNNGTWSHVEDGIADNYFHPPTHQNSGHTSQVNVMVLAVTSLAVMLNLF